MQDGARTLALALAWLASGALLGARAPGPSTDARQTSQTSPASLWLWAWERPEDLRFLEGRSDVGVAYLARTIVVAGDVVTVRPRRQPLRVGESTPLTAVVRIEVPRGLAPSQGTIDALAREALRALDGARTKRLQLDFDARASEIPYYRALLERLRASLPPGVWLGMTALAAWCADERSWLSSPPPVDDVVPMVFSMGNDSARVRAWLVARGGFSVEACRGALGLSTAELPLFSRVPADTRVVHAFSPSPWNTDLVARVSRVSPPPEQP